MKKIYMLTLFAALSCPAMAQSGFLACYPFSGTADDARGTGYNGTTYNLSNSSDRYGNSNSAYSFSGSQSSILIDNTSLRLSEYSYSVWIKPTQLPNNAYQCIWANGGSTYDQHLLLAHDALNGRYGFTFGSWDAGGNSNTCSPGMTPNANQWYHVVVTRSTDSMKMYVNGSLICQMAALQSPAYTGSNNTLSIGSRNSTMSQNFKGVIDDFKIFNRAITASEVYTIMNGSCWALSVNDKMASLPKTIYNCVGDQLLINSASMTEAVKSVKVYSMNDQLVLSANHDLASLNMSDFANGMYILRIELNQGHLVTQKIIKGL